MRGTNTFRVHLQHLGHPIANDPIYANRNVFTNLDEAKTATDEDLIARLDKMGKTVSSSTLVDAAIKESDPTENITLLHGLDNPEGREMWSGEICDVCGTQLYLDPAPGELEIWLHAWKYSWKVPATEEKPEELLSFESEVPPWGKEDWEKGISFSRPRRRSSLSPSSIQIVEGDTPALLNA
jgi:tRNA pseudouridine32 synthase